MLNEEHTKLVFFLALGIFATKLCVKKWLPCVAADAKRTRCEAKKSMNLEKRVFWPWFGGHCGSWVWVRGVGYSSFFLKVKLCNRDLLQPTPKFLQLTLKTGHFYDFKLLSFCVKRKKSISRCFRLTISFLGAPVLNIKLVFHDTQYSQCVYIWG